MPCENLLDRITLDLKDAVILLIWMESLKGNVRGTFFMREKLDEIRKKYNLSWRKLRMIAEELYRRRDNIRIV